MPATPRTVTAAPGTTLIPVPPAVYGYAPVPLTYTGTVQVTYMIVV